MSAEGIAFGASVTGDAPAASERMPLTRERSTGAPPAAAATLIRTPRRFPDGVSSNISFWRDAGE